MSLHATSFRAWIFLLTFLSTIIEMQTSPIFEPQACSRVLIYNKTRAFDHVVHSFDRFRFLRVVMLGKPDALFQTRFSAISFILFLCVSVEFSSFRSSLLQARHCFISLRS